MRYLDAPALTQSGEQGESVLQSPTGALAQGGQEPSQLLPVELGGNEAKVDHLQRHRKDVLATLFHLCPHNLQI